MNKTKMGLLIAVIILNFLNAGLNVYFIVNIFLHVQFNQLVILEIVYDFISIAGFLTSAGLLIYAIANKGQNFTSRTGYYLSAVTITLFMNLFSVSSLLLIISMFISDIVWVKPIDDVYFEAERKMKEKEEEVAKARKEKEAQISKLRERLEKGEITDEEFKSELLKLL